MNTRSDNQIIISVIDTLNGLVQFGIKHNHVFIPVNNISIDERGKLYYINNNEKNSVSSLIKQVKGLQTARWLNHLYFIDGFGNTKSLKKYISKRYNLEFS
jgi:hypothetical protein